MIIPLGTDLGNCHFEVDRGETLGCSFKCMSTRLLDASRVENVSSKFNLNQFETFKDLTEILSLGIIRK